MNKKDIRLIISVSMLLSITVCFFGPVEYYISNINEIWFDLKDIIGYLFAVTLIIIFLLISLFYFPPYKFSFFLICIVFSLGVSSYLQGNFLNPSYGVLNGVSINWKNYTLYGIVNVGIWFLILIAPYLIKKIKGTIFLNKIMKICSTFIVMIELVTLVILFITMGGKTKETTFNEFRVTSDDLFTFSTDSNILVYILDTFDAKYMDDLLQSNPELAESTFKDFYYYDNVLASYPTTKGALPQILTGKWYYNEVPYSEYIKTAWNETKLYDNLEKQGYDIELYTDSLYISPDKKNISNINYKSDMEQKNEISNKTSLIALFYKMVAFKYMPHYLKANFVTYSGDLDEYKSNGTYSTSNDFLIHKTLKNNGIKLQKDKIFKISHLLGAHPPYIMDFNGERVENSTVLQQCMGVINIMNSIFTELKTQDLYDNSTIILMADHGEVSGMGQNPVFLVKDKTYKGKMKVSHLPISYDDLPLIFNESINNNKINEYINHVVSENRVRQFCYYDWITDGSWDKDNLPPITQYVLQGDVKKMELAKVLNITHYDDKGNVIIYPYTIGKKITFDNDKNNENNFSKFALYGFSGSEEDTSWSLGSESSLVLPLGKKQTGDLQLTINFSYILGEKQELKIYCNDRLISDETNNILSRTYTIPGDCIEDGTLKLKFQYPNAAMPKQTNEGEDSRILAFSFRDILLTQK